MDDARRVPDLEGTPSGVGRLSPGDRVAVEVAGIRLENSVAHWPAS